jgi:hypothetical protein
MSQIVLAAHARPSFANRDVKQPVARMEPTGRAKRAPDGKLHAIRDSLDASTSIPDFSSFHPGYK